VALCKHRRILELFRIDQWARRTVRTKRYEQKTSPLGANSWSDTGQGGELLTIRFLIIYYYIIRRIAPRPVPSWILLCFFLSRGRLSNPGINFSFARLWFLATRAAVTKEMIF
jgi:hypothetical protein